MSASPITIRPETPADAEVIGGVIRQAFLPLPSGGRNEAAIVAELRREGALAVSLVAETPGEIVGHVAFSSVSISDGSRGWYGLGPLAVLPGYQRQGIGRRLVEKGLKSLGLVGSVGCVVLGAPSYYRRFGFLPYAGLRFPGPPPEYFLAIAFHGKFGEGLVSYHHTFSVTG